MNYNSIKVRQEHLPDGHTLHIASIDASFSYREAPWKRHTDGEINEMVRRGLLDMIYGPIRHLALKGSHDLQSDPQVMRASMLDYPGLPGPRKVPLEEKIVSAFHPILAYSDSLVRRPSSQISE